MAQEISILITGNPEASSGFKAIGSIGEGLTAVDPRWPSQVTSPSLVAFRTEANATVYRLQYRESMITSIDSNRPGCLNFQILIPANKVVVNRQTGQIVSPYTLLSDLDSAYRDAHLKEYKNVAGWSFKADAKMSPEELSAFLSAYELQTRRMPQRPMTGSGQGIIICSKEAATALLADHCYSEFCDYEEIAVATQGTSTPALAALKIPRTPAYDVYVNGKRYKNLSVRPGDKPMEISITPDHPSYQNPQLLTIDFDKAEADGLVNRADERIDYSVRNFPDKKKTVKVELKFEGEKFTATEISNIANNLQLKDAGGREGIASDYRYDGKQDMAIFTISGRQILGRWEPVIVVMPKNVIIKSTSVDIDGTTVLTLLKSNAEPKPTPSTRPGGFGGNSSPFGKVDDTHTSNGGDCVSLTVIATAHNFKGAIPPCRITFPGMIVTDIHFDRRSQQSKTSGNAYEAVIRLPKANYDAIAKNQELPVRCQDKGFEADFANFSSKNGTIKIEVYEKTSLAKFMGSAAGRIVKWTLLVLLLVAAGYFIRGFVQPAQTAPAAPTQTTATQNPGKSGKGDATSGKVNKDGKSSDNLSETDQQNPNETGENGLTQEKLAEQQRQAEEDAKKARIAELQNQANNYYNLLKQANVSFAQLDEIATWLTANQKDSKPINGYDRIKSALQEFQKCRKLLEQMTDPDKISDELAGQVLDTAKNLPNDGNENTQNSNKAYLKNLRLKMQSLTFIQRRGYQNKQYVKSKISDLLTNRAGQAVTSFSDL